MKDRDIEVVLFFSGIAYVGCLCVFAMFRIESGQWRNRSPISIAIESLLWPVVVMAWFVKWLFTPMK